MVTLKLLCVLTMLHVAQCFGNCALLFMEYGEFCELFQPFLVRLESEFRGHTVLSRSQPCGMSLAKHVAVHIFVCGIQF